MNQKIKNAAKLLCFGLIAAAVTIPLANTLNWKESNGITYLYAREADTADVIAFGSSHTYCTVNTALMWQEYGMAVLNMGESGQLVGNTCYYMQEALKTQHPKIALIELYCLQFEDSGFIYGNLYRNTMNVDRFGGNFVENLTSAVEHTGYDQTKRNEIAMNVTLGFPVYHTRYREVTEADYTYPRLFDGNFSSNWHEDGGGEPDGCYNEERAELTASQLNNLQQVVRLCEANGITPVFFVAPFDVTEAEMAHYNAVGDWCEEQGYAYYNFNLPELFEEIDLDWYSDFCNNDYGHLSNNGSEKVTLWLAEHLAEDYELPDRRGEQGYEVYEAISAHWNHDVAAKELKHTGSVPEAAEILADAGLEWVILAEDPESAVASLQSLSLPEDFLHTGLAASREAKDGLIRLSEHAVIALDGATAKDAKVFVDTQPWDDRGSHLQLLAVDPDTGKVVYSARYLHEGEEYFMQDDEE